MLSFLPCIVSLGGSAALHAAFSQLCVINSQVCTAGSDSALNFSSIPEDADWRLGCLASLSLPPGGVGRPGKSQGR